MTPIDPDEELDNLRARAYGPDADIADDPVAWARLESLEALHRAAAPAAESVREVVAPDAVHRSSPAENASAGTLGDDAIRPGRPVPDSPMRDAGHRALPAGHRRLLPALWVVSLVAAAFVGGGVSRGVPPAAPHPTTSAEGPASAAGVDVTRPAVATLGLLEGTWPALTFGARPGGRQFEWFHDMAVLQVPDLQAGGGASCLVVVAYARWNAGYVADDCGTGLPRSIAALVVTEEAPKSLRDAYPIGTKLLFVLDSDHVKVFAGEAQT